MPEMYKGVRPNDQEPLPHRIGFANFSSCPPLSVVVVDSTDDPNGKENPTEDRCKKDGSHGKVY